MSQEIHIFANLTAKPGEEAAIRAILSALVAPTRQEPGNLHYMLHEDLKAPGNFFFFESYKDKAAVEAHMASPHLAEAFRQAGPLLAKPADIHQTSLLDGA